MKEYKIILAKDEIEILTEYLNSGELDSPTIEDAILRGILHQIQDQEETEYGVFIISKPKPEEDGFDTYQGP